VSGLVPHLFQVKLGKQPGQDLCPLPFGQFLAKLQNSQEIFFNSQLAEHRGFLRQITQAQAGAFVHWQVGDLTAVQENVASVQLPQAHNQAESGSLARPIWT
jgi:hypothetical protein